MDVDFSWNQLSPAWTEWYEKICIYSYSYCCFKKCGKDHKRIQLFSGTNNQILLRRFVTDPWNIYGLSFKFYWSTYRFVRDFIFKWWVWTHAINPIILIVNSNCENCFTFLFMTKFMEHSTHTFTNLSIKDDERDWLPIFPNGNPK